MDGWGRIGEEGGQSSGSGRDVQAYVNTAPVQKCLQGLNFQAWHRCKLRRRKGVGRGQEGGGMEAEEVEDERAVPAPHC